jgi:tetratricopeptide (TPR) repeat protein
VKIVSVTIAHNRESTIAGALSSVAPFVDEHLILDTGITDATIDVAIESCTAPVYVSSDPWRNDFSRARNAALDFARKRSADWAVMIDTDQRIDWRGTDLRRVLKFDTAAFGRGKNVSVYTLRSRDGRHVKEQIFRLPRMGAYEGRTHECFPLANAREYPQARVWEVPKSSDEIRAGRERDLTILQEDAASHPERARTWFYLAETLLGLSHKAEASVAHQECYRRSKSPVEAAWSAYRLAQLACAEGSYETAGLWCERGYQKIPDMVELSNYEAWIRTRQGNYRAALDAADRALYLGSLRGNTKTAISFPTPKRTTTGPRGSLRLRPEP